MSDSRHCAEVSLARALDAVAKTDGISQKIILASKALSQQISSQKQDGEEGYEHGQRVTQVLRKLLPQIHNEQLFCVFDRASQHQVNSGQILQTMEDNEKVKDIANALIHVAFIVFTPSVTNAQCGHYTGGAVTETFRTCHESEACQIGENNDFWRADFFVWNSAEERIYIKLQSSDSPVGAGHSEPTEAWSLSKFKDRLGDEFTSSVNYGTAGLTGAANYRSYKFYKGGQMMDRATQAKAGGEHFKLPKHRIDMLTKVIGRSATIFTVGSLGCSLWDCYQKEDWKGMGNKLISFAAGLGVGWVVGAVVGAAFAIPIGGIAAAMLGAVASIVASSAVSSWNSLGDLIGGNLVGLFGDGNGGGDKGGPGGVDLRRLPRLAGLHCNAALAYCLRLGVDVSLPPWTSMEDVVSLVNDRLRPATPLDGKAILSLLMHEAFYLTQVMDVPILFSLHFCGDSGQVKDGSRKGDADLYSVMHPALRHTLTGRVLGFLDFLLKSYLNGGTFSEHFLQDYDGARSRAELQEAVIDFRSELRNAGRQGTAEERAHLPKRYECLHDLLDQEEGDAQAEEAAANYHSAFRIIGTIGHSAELDATGAVVPLLHFPHVAFDVESDLNVLPARAAQNARCVIESDPDANSATDKGMSHHSRIVEAYEQMRHIIEQDMPRFPRIAPYFALLRIICACCATAPSLARAGRIPEIPAVGEPKQEPLFPPFPSLMPPLPIRKSSLLLLQYSAKQMFYFCFGIGRDVVLPKIMVPVNKFLYGIAIDGTNGYHSSKEAMYSARTLARDYVLHKLPANSASLREYSNEELFVPRIAQFVMERMVLGLEILLSRELIFSAQALDLILQKNLSEKDVLDQGSGAEEPDIDMEKLVLGCQGVVPKVSLLIQWIPHWKKLSELVLCKVEVLKRTAQRERESQSLRDKKEVITKHTTMCEELRVQEIAKMVAQMQEQRDNLHGIINLKVDTVPQGYQVDALEVECAHKQVDVDVNKAIECRTNDINNHFSTKMAGVVNLINQEHAKIIANIGRDVEAQASKMRSNVRSKMEHLQSTIDTAVATAKEMLLGGGLQLLYNQLNRAAAAEEEKSAADSQEEMCLGDLLTITSA